MLSEFNYECPSCQHRLNEGGDIYFRVKDKDTKMSELRLSKQPGVYGYKSHHDLHIKNGETLSFYCPHCHTNLQSDDRPYFIEIDLIIAEEMMYKLYFSPICGERVTYVELEGELGRFGSDFLCVMPNGKRA